MAAQLFLLTPDHADPQTFPQRLAAVLDAAEVPALLVQRRALSDAAYGALVTAILPIAQKASCAVLVENSAALAIELGADGVHMSADLKAVKAAIADLKPNMIVGVGPCASRHDAMTFGELDIDYLFFGPLDGPADPSAAETADWWAETFEVPAVLSDPTATTIASRAEFVALSTSLWSAPDAAAFITAVTA